MILPSVSSWLSTSLCFYYVSAQNKHNSAGKPISDSNFFSLRKKSKVIVGKLTWCTQLASVNASFGVQMVLPTTTFPGRDGLLMLRWPPSSGQILHSQKNFFISFWAVTFSCFLLPYKYNFFLFCFSLQGTWLLGIHTIFPLKLYS